MRRMIVFVLAASFVFLISPVHAQGLKKVKLTMPVVALSMAPIYLAQARGYFAEEGLDVEMTSTGGGGPDIRALIAGEADLPSPPAIMSSWPTRRASVFSWSVAGFTGYS